MSETNGRLLIDADEAAELLAVTRAQVYRAARDGGLPSVKIGRYLRFRREALAAWVIEQERNTVGAGQR